MSAFPIAVLASGGGTNLQAILDRLHSRGAVEVVAVASDKPEARALQRAEQAGVPTSVFPPEQFADREQRDVALADWLVERGAELVVLAGYMQLLSAGFVRRFPGRVINVHPALLPSFPGLQAIEQALEHGVRVTGVTIHFVDEGIDTGPIILQRAVELPYTRTMEDLTEEIHRTEHELLPHAIELIAAGAVHINARNPRRVRVDER